MPVLLSQSWKLSSTLALILSVLALFVAFSMTTTPCAAAASGSCSVGDLETFSSAITVNEDGNDADTRIEGDTDNDLWFVDAGNDRVGISTAAPAALLDVGGAFIATTIDGVIGSVTPAAATATTITGDAVVVGSTERIHLDGSTGGNTYIFEESSDDAHWVVGGFPFIQIDEDTDSIGIGLSQAPSTTARLQMGGPFATASTVARGLYVSGAITNISGTIFGTTGTLLENSVVLQDVGDTVQVVSQLRLVEPSISVGGDTDTVTIAATLYIANAPTEGDTNAAIWIQAGDLLFPDGVVDIGKTATRAANVWADLINGADYGYDNGWRMLESDTYQGYGPGIAIDFGDHFSEGEALAVKRVDNGRTKQVEVGSDGDGHPIFETHPALDRERVTDVQRTPVFALTNDFIEFHGVRITLDDWIALAALAAAN